MKIADMSPEARRAYNAAAKRKERAKLAEKSDKAKAAAIEKQQDEHEKYIRAGRNPHFFGEEAPGRDAKTHDSELSIHREFLRALNQPDVQEGETLRMVAKRVWDAWLVGRYSFEREYVPAFNRRLQQFDPDFGFAISDKYEWEPPKDCTGDEPIDVVALPELPKLAKQEKAKPEQPTPSVAPVVTQPVPVAQPTEIRFSWTELPDDARRYMEGRR
jgi:hypothetical protein